MPAKITVQSGIAAGASHWIQQRVVRIGSDPTAEVCLPSANVPSHALTLEFRDGNYRVYNRCRDNVFVGTRVVEPNRVATWFDTDILQLDDVELVIDIEDDPTPRPLRKSVMASFGGGNGEDTDGAIQEATPQTVAPDAALNRTGKSQSNTLVQLAVIVACLLGSVLLLMRHNARSVSGAAGADQLQFEDVIQQAFDSPTTNRQLIQRLQFAQQANVRGNRSEARSRFSSLRSDLVAERTQFEKEKRIPELAILQFVEAQIGELAD